MQEEYCKPFVLSMTTTNDAGNEEQVRFLVENQNSMPVLRGRRTGDNNQPPPWRTGATTLRVWTTACVTLIVRNVLTAARITLYEPTVGELL